MTQHHIAGHTKKTCWGVFERNRHLLKGLCEGPEVSDSTLQDAEVFFCKLYGAMTADDINAVRLSMLVKGMPIKRLPPTRDALYFHIQRSHYQTLVWQEGHLQRPVLPPPETMGWKLEDNVLVPKLMSLPAVPDACEDHLWLHHWMQDSPMWLQA